MGYTTPVFRPSRRDFLKQVGLLGMAAGLPSIYWSCSSKSSGSAYQGTGVPPYRIWEEMLMALETSPDFLKGRMQELINQGEPEAMFRFVRDEIHLMPPHPDSLREAGHLMRYGIPGVLRYGFATPREKVELLRHMYAAVDIPCSVVYERLHMEPAEVASFFFRPVNRVFKPIIDEQTWKRWKRDMQAEESTSEVIQPDPGQRISNDLAESLWEQLPEKEKLRPETFSFRWPVPQMPTLEFEWESKTQHAHLFDPAVPFGSLKAQGTLSPAMEAVFPDEKVHLRLSYRNGINPKEERLLVEGEWPVHELAGNQLVLSFPHGLDLEEKLRTPIGNLRLFTPAISFQSFHQDPEYMASRSFLGNPVSLEGNTIDLSGEQASFGDKKLLPKPSASLQKQIQSLRLEAIPGAYPQVKLKVFPSDDNNQLLEGLAATDFAIMDNGKPIQAIMESNQKTPRVLLLCDVSSSMPLHYRNEGMKSFVAALKTRILEAFPGTQMNVWETDSDLYTWLTKASRTSNDLILYATDGDNNDVYDSDRMENLKSGPPALVLNVNDETDMNSKETFGNMATATNGQVIMAKDQQKTIESVTAYLEALEIPPYVFTYYSAEADATHQVSLSADQQRVKAEATYQFEIIPEEDSPAGEQLIGLYLTMKVGKEEINRVLAGWDPLLDKYRVPTFRDSKEVRNRMLGTTLIAVEGEGPTLSNALIDILKYRLSTRKWGEALIQGDYETAVAAIGEAGYIYDENLASLMQPLQESVTDHSFTFASGPRMSISSYHPGVDTEFSTYSFDYLPTSHYTSLALDPKEAFKTTLTKTAQLAVLENTIFETSSLSLLERVNLVSAQEARGTDWFRKLSQEGPDARYWRERVSRGGHAYYKLFDPSGREKAFWQIDRKTGELYGLLPDLSGGGSNSMESQLKDLDKVMKMYSLIFAAIGVGSLGVGIYQAYGMMLVKLYAIASEAIIIMDTSGMDEKIIAAMKEFACNVKNSITLATMGVVGAFIGGLNDLIGLMDGGSLPGLKC